MKKIVIVISILLFDVKVNGQGISLKNLFNLLDQNVSIASNDLKGKGWYFYTTTNNSKYKKHIWYFDGKARVAEGSSVEVIAKFWINKVFSNNSKYQSIDYQCDYNTYKLLLVQSKQQQLDFVESGDDGIRKFDTYKKGSYRIDFIEYSNNKFGVIIHKNLK